MYILRFLTIWVPIVVLAAIIFGVVNSPSFDKCKAEASESYYSPEQQEEHSSRFVFTLAGCFVRENRDSITAVATSILAIFTVILAIGASIQISDTRILQRAYLNILPAGVEPYTSNVAKLACDFFIYNAGNLPATKISWITDRCLKVESDFDPPVLKVTEKSSNIVAPKLRIRKGSVFIPDKELDSFRSECAHKGSQCWLYLWGTVTYYDGFQDRWIRFCHRYNLAGTTGTTINIRHARQHEHGNATDESD